jgi:hypothetical protein
MTDITVVVSSPDEFTATLATSGLQGPKGDKGDVGDVNPQMNVILGQTEAARDAAQGFSTTAQGAASTATTKAGEATGSASAAAGAAASALLSENNATSASNAAFSSMTTASGSATLAQGFATSAQSSATNASGYAGQAAASASSAQNASSAAQAQAGVASTQAGIALAQAGIATTQAGIATTKAGEAEAARAAAVVAQGLAEDAAASTDADVIATAADAAATAADRVQTGLDAAATAADRIQTGLDAAATAADRVQTGLDAVATAADRVQTGLDAASADADAAAADANAAAASNSAGQAAGSAAQALAIYGSTAAQQAAVTAAQSAASLAEGYAASASSVVQQDLSGITAAALHRSPNAVTAMFVYDTSKDSDGGAWTEKCQHTSWYNEDINGKWLGAQESEALARATNGVLGPELIANGDFSSTTNWGTFAGASIADGKLTLNNESNSRAERTGNPLSSNKTYTFEIDIVSNSGSFAVVAYDGAGVPNISGPLIYGAGRQTFSIVVGTTTGNFRIIRQAGAQVIESISVKEVTAQTTQTGDYFQLTTDGKFYKLNDTSGTTEVFRGNKRDFPRLAGIVAEAANVTVYDLTEPGRPMWMRFNSGASGSTVLSFNAANPNIPAVAALSGVLVICTLGPNGAFIFRFPSDSTFIAYTTANGLRNNAITERNSPTSFGPAYADRRYGIDNNAVTAVAMCVLPNSPIDINTGLAAPTIALATQARVTVIQHTGVSVGSSSTSGFNSIAITPQLLSATRTADATFYWAQNPGLLGASFALSTRTNAQAPDFNNGNTSGLIGLTRSELLRRSSTAATVQKLKNFESDPAKSAAATITNTYNTGHQPGDIRRTYLSDNVVESVSGTELVVNGDFSTNDLTGWTVNNTANSVISAASGALSVQTSVASEFPNVTQGTYIAGKTYLLTFTKISGATADGSDCQFRLDSSPGSEINFGTQPAGTYSRVWYCRSNGPLTFIKRGSTTTAVVVDDISVTEVVADRSYKARSASIVGTLVKTQVASAADLVAYSGFSAANYLREPYSADLDFGTGEWSVGAWVNVPVTLSYTGLPLGPELVANGDFSNGTTSWEFNNFAGAPNELYEVVDGRLRVFVNNSSGSTVSQNILTAGKTYKFTATVEVVSGRVEVALGSSDGAIYVTPAGAGTYSIEINGISVTGGAIRINNYINQNAEYYIDNVSVKEVAPMRLFERAHSSGPVLSLGVNAAGRLTATAFDGTTTRTVTTTAAYNTATWLNAKACYTTDGTLAIRVNGVEVAATRGNPLLTLNNSNAVLTIGNSFALDAPFPGSIALLKLSATVPTPEQSVWMYEQEKQLFRAGAMCCLPDAGSIVDLTYDEATDKWIAASATNRSEFSGLVRTSVTATPAGSYSRLAAAGGVTLQARTTTSPGVDITIPSYGLREELVKRAEAAARLNAQLATFDYVGGFTANTTTGNTAIVSVAGLTYPTSYIGARVSGSGIPANTTIVAVSGTTIYLSAAATATATGVQVSFVDYVLPVGYEAKEVSLAGAAQREGATQQFTRLFDGFKETIRFGTPPSNTALIQIQAARSAA